MDVVPELRVAGEVVATGERLALGEEMDFAFRVNQRGIGMDTADKRVAAGSYLHVTVAGGSVSPARLEQVRQRVEETTGILDSEDDQQLASLTREALLGDLFHAGMLGYFAQLDVFSRQQAREVGARVNLAPSAGTYGYIPNVNTLFGMPMEITPGGVTMDLDRIARTLSEPADAEIDRATLNTQIGALTSALEHGIPEQQFSTEDEPAEGISAAKALAIANAQGQRIYTIDRSNRDEALAALRLSSNTVSEIRQAVNAGRVVTTHTDPVTVPGWQGGGYVVLDPETGSGAWLIEGGLNGGSIADPVLDTFTRLVQSISIITDALGEIAERALQAIKKDLGPKVREIARRNSYFGVILSVVDAIVGNGNINDVLSAAIETLILGAIQSLLTGLIVVTAISLGLAFSGVLAFIAAILAFLIVMAIGDFLFSFILKDGKKIEWA